MLSFPSLDRRTLGFLGDLTPNVEPHEGSVFRLGSGCHGGQPDVGIVGDAGERFKRHITPCDRPFVAGLQHQGADEADDGLVVGEWGHDCHRSEGMPKRRSRPRAASPRASPFRAGWSRRSGSSARGGTTLVLSRFGAAPLIA